MDDLHTISIRAMENLSSATLMSQTTGKIDSQNREKNDFQPEKKNSLKTRENTFIFFRRDNIEQFYH